MPEPETKIRRVMDDLTRRIAAGEWRPGTRLPGRRQLAAEYEVSISTIRTVRDRLEAAGIVEVVAKGGMYVRLGR